MVYFGDNLEIVIIVIIFNWNLMLRGGLTEIMGHVEGRLGFLSLISQFKSITTFYLTTYDLL